MTPPRLDKDLRDFGKYQQNRTSTILQFELYFRLRQECIGVIPEVRFPSKWHQSGYFHADLAIVDEDGEPCALIECKKSDDDIPAKQLKAYTATHLPFRIVDETDDVDDLLLWAAFREAELTQEKDESRGGR